MGSIMWRVHNGSPPVSRLTSQLVCQRFPAIRAEASNISMRRGDKTITRIDWAKRRWCCSPAALSRRSRVGSGAKKASFLKNETKTVIVLRCERRAWPSLCERHSVSFSRGTLHQFASVVRYLMERVWSGAWLSCAFNKESRSGEFEEPKLKMRMVKKRFKCLPVHFNIEHKHGVTAFWMSPPL